jgi:hypothetical protein
MPPFEGDLSMQNTNGIAALARLMKYCEDEAAGLRLPFIAYCLSMANVALAEEVGGEETLRLASK